MIFTPLIEKKEIREAFYFVADRMEKDSEHRKITFSSKPGIGPEIEVLWNKSLGIWSFFDPCNKDECHENGYWCPFGVQDPSQFPSQSSTCEINFPKNGINRRYGGVFVRDDVGNIYLTHNGGVGGGKPGIGKEEFRKYISKIPSTDNITVIWPDRKETKVICIGRLGDPEFPSKIANFVHNVSCFKESFQKGST